MSDIIHLLPDSVANQIAAGEVIQRPASVIKELVENSVDAGAKRIDIYIKDAGRTLIQVIDDGKGMTATDARMAFERHATSKISAASDLFTLVTMGFRGEALPSICAISQLEMRTRTDADRLGTSLKINCSRVENQEACVCDRGTNIMVRNIFCNLPARRKFLKSDSVELANIMREFERLALVNNKIHLTLDTGNKKIDLRPATLKQRITDIWKNNLNMQLLPVEVDTAVVKISGYVSRPEYARRRNPLQFLIVNGRNMRHPYFHKAIISCFEQLIAPDTQPCYFLKFEVDPATIDVNIHPTKNEIKFENESEIWRILAASVRAALGKFSAVPSIDFTSDALPSKAVAPGEHVEAPKVNLNPKYNPFKTTAPASNPGTGAPPSSAAYRPTRVSSGWSKLYTEFMEGVRTSGQESKPSGAKASATPEAPQTPTGEPDKIFSSEETAAESPICFQHALKYIITSSAQGLLVIDQHRAHVRILYERFLARARAHSGVGQRVMFPQTITLDPSQQLTFEGVEDELTRLGFQLARCAENDWKIEMVPSLLINADARDVILRILDSVSDDSVNYGNEGSPAESMLQRVALVMARSSAITRGTQLSAREMEHIVSQLFSLREMQFTPNGNPIVKIIDDETLESLFL